MTLSSKCLYLQRLWNIFFPVQHVQKEEILIYLGGVMYVPTDMWTVECVVQEKQHSLQIVLSCRCRRTDNSSIALTEATSPSRGSWNAWLVSEGPKI